jgi:HPt (histidine-containing phosphotransfer) domain-containing protein
MSESGTKLADELIPELLHFNHALPAESCGENPALVAEVLEMAHTSVPDRFERIRAVVALRDGHRADTEAHALKGTFLAIGADVLAATRQRLIGLGVSSQWADVDSTVGFMVHEWTHLRRALERYRRTLRIQQPGAY